MAKGRRSLLAKLWDSFSGLRPVQSRDTRLRRLLVEVLEDRCTPAGFGTIQGVIFNDADFDGLFSGADARLTGVQVSLVGITTGANGNTSVNVNTTTNADGTYQFTSVPLGAYRLDVGAVAALLNGPAQSFSPLTVASDGQTVQQNVAFHSGLAPEGISIIQFLTTSESLAHPFGTPGTGAGVGNHTPTASAISPVSLGANDANKVIDLAANFRDADFTNSQVTFNITNGTTPEAIKLTLFDAEAPATVTNFFDYVLSGKYDESMFHRLTSKAQEGIGVLQGGALELTNPAGTDLNTIPAGPQIPNEFNAARSNVTGTIAMAQSGTPDSASSQFFFNTENNATSLDSQQFAVFGKVADDASQQALDRLALTNIMDLSGTAFATAHPTALMKSTPLHNYAGPLSGFATNAVKANYITIDSVAVDKRDEFLTYTIQSNSNAVVADAVLNNEFLSIDPKSAGTTTITVKATDRFGASTTTTINVTVTGNATPVANDGTLTTDQNTSANGTLSASDPDPTDTLTFSVVSQPSKGTVNITNAATGAYTFNPGTAFKDLPIGQSSNVTFTFKATDNHGTASAIKTVTVTVTGLNDAPVANDGVASTNQNFVVSSALSASDPDTGDTITFSIVNQPAAGSVTLNNASTGVYTFDPGTDFVDLAGGQTRTTTFTFKATDNHTAVSATKTITITVTGVNDAPVASNGTLAANPTTPVSGMLLATDPDTGDTLTFSIEPGSGPAKGTVTLDNASTGAYTFDPGTDFASLTSGQSEIVTFDFKATDNHTTSSIVKTITITVTAP